MSAVNTKIRIMGVVLPLAFTFVLGLLLFIEAGNMFWFYGWIFLIFLYSFVIALSMWWLRHDPGLLE